jgi:hypothetical protein
VSLPEVFAVRTETPVLAIDTISLSKDNAAARRRRRKRITNTLKKPTTMPTKLAKESELV